MITDLWLIGIGTGSAGHITLEGQRAMCDAAVILVPHKGSDKDDLAEIRYRLIKASGTQARVVPFEYPVRDPNLPYQDRVIAWHDEIALRWQKAVPSDASGPVALLVWGDPSLYDSTLRIAERLTPSPDIRVVPGITAVQALTAAHAIPINEINGPFTVTTGRRLRDDGWPSGCDTLVVMLDGELSFSELAMPDAQIWWGAYLGSDAQVLLHGSLGEMTEQIRQTRAALRQKHGWIMDTYLIRR